MKRLPTLDERFFSKVRMTSECWMWTASGNGTGYGMVNEDGRKRYAHRVAYERMVGPIPDGMQIDHLCRTRACVRPDHLEPVTPAENLLRAGLGSAKLTCVRGHLLSGANVRIEIRNGWACRVCRSCGRTRDRQRKGR